MISNFPVGSSVPIPTLPSDVMRSLSTLLVLATILPLVPVSIVSTSVSPSKILSEDPPPPPPVPTGQEEFTTPGSHTWTVPSGVTSVSVVCVGAGGTGSASVSYTHLTLPTKA